MVCTLICKLMVSNIAQIRANSSNLAKDSRVARKEEQTLLKNFMTFIKDNKNDIENQAIFKLLVAHGKIEECKQFAKATNSHKELIVHYINTNSFDKALIEMQMIQDKKERVKYMNIYATLLF